MKNRLILVVFSLAGIMAAPIMAHALLLQGPNQFIAPYPQVLSYPLEDLPQGFITLSVGYETYYYSAGVFYQKIMRDQVYVAVPPPIGAVVFSIPLDYQLMLIDGISYYESRGVYYKRVLEGYKVIYPPV